MVFGKDQSNKGKKMLRDQSREKNPFYNKTHSNQVKKRLSEFAKARKNEKSPVWKGGKTKLRGYIQVLSPNHPYANSKGYVFEHRLVMEKHIGRVLLPTEVVHHINENHEDNRIENLMLFSNTPERLKYHRRQKQWQ